MFLHAYFNIFLRCRHASISKYFDEDDVPACNGACDVCKNPKEVKKMIDMYSVNIKFFILVWKFSNIVIIARNQEAWDRKL